MSNTIDQRVVEMRFDNSHFEKNVSTTMSTLEKLKQKLNLSGASKGLDDINASAKNVNMNGLGSAVETVTAKFSALQVMGVTALANITNSAVNAGKNIVKSLTIDPIKSGFEEYETKMGSIQTILANTEHQGTTLNDVTRALDELNTYADKTIYNFQQMTKNIGTFTAAGVDLDTSVRSIQGIANLAAVSGSTSQQASTAMYQLSQALATGTVKLQDWNSVVNAGMGGKVFQNALIRTAAMMDGAAKDVQAWQKKNIDAYGSFRESLTRGEWLTSEVLTRTLEQFTMAAEEGSKEWEEFKKSLTESGYTEAQAEEILKMANTATDAATKVKTFTQLLDTLKESAQSGWAQTWELIVGDFEEAKAFFTDLSDLFGGMIGKSADRRNSLFGDALSSNYDKLISKINDAGIQTEQFEESLSKVVGKDKLDPLITEFGSLENVIRKGKVSSDDIKQAISGIGETASKVSSGLSKVKETLKFGSTGEDVKEAQQALIDLGYDLHKYGADGLFKWETQQAVKAFQKDKGLKHDAVIGPETLAALREAVGTTEELTEENGKLIDSYDDLADAITKKSGRELLLESLMNVIHAIHRPLAAVGEAFRNTFSISSDQLYNTIDGLNKLTGAFVMEGVLDAKTWEELDHAIGDLGLDVGEFEKRLGEVLSEHGVDVTKLIEKYGSLGEAFNKGAISFDHVKEALLGFEGVSEAMLLGGESAEKLRRTFKGLFSILKTFATFAGGGLSFAFRILQTVLSKLDLGILDFTAMVGDALVGFSDFVNNIIDTSFGALFDWLFPKLETGVKTIQEWLNAIKGFGPIKGIIDGLKNWPATLDRIGTAFGNGKTKIEGFVSALEGTSLFQTVSKWISEAATAISDAITNIQDKFEEFDTSAFMTKLETFGSFIAGIAGSLANSETFVSIVDMICGAIGKLWGYLTSFKLPEFNLDNINLFSKQMNGIFEQDGQTGGIFSAFGAFLKDSANYQLETIQKNVVAKFADFWNKTGDKVVAAFEMCKKVAKAIKEFIFGTDKVDLPTILDVAEKFLGIIVLIQALKTLRTLASPFDGVASALNNVAASFKWDAIAGAFKAMALALGAFALCVYVISGIADMNKAWQAFAMLAGLMVLMGGVITAIGWVGSKFDSGVGAATTILTVLGFVGSLVLLLYAIKQIDEVDLKDPVGTFGLLITSLLTLTVGVRAIAAAGGSSFKSVAAILTLLTALQMILTVITAYDEYSWAGKLDAIVKMIGMLMVISTAINIASRGVKDGSVKGLALTILALIVSLKMMVGIIEDFAAMDNGTLIKGGLAVTILMAVMGGILSAISYFNRPMIFEKGQKAVSNFTGLATALLAVVAAIWILGKLATKDPETFKAGAITVGAILLAFTGMLAAVGATCSGLKIGSIVTMMIGMGLLIGELAVIVYKMQDVPWQQSVGTAVALGGLLLAMSAALRIMGKNDVKIGDLLDWVTVTVLMTVIVGFLARFLYQLKDVQPANAIASAAALGGLLLAMAAVFNILASKETKPKTIERWVMGLLELSIVLAVLAMVMHLMDGIDPVNAIGQAAALSLLLLAMAATLKILAKHQHKPETISKWTNGLFALSGVVFVLGLVLRMLEGLDANAAIGHAQALSMLLLAMSGVMAVLALINAVKLDMTGLQSTVRGFAGVAAAAVILAVALSAMNGVENAVENAQALALLAVALSVAMIPLAAAGKIAMGGGLVQSVGALIVVALALAVVVNYLSAITNVDAATANAKTLSNLAIALSIAMIPLAIAGNMSLTGGIAVSMIALIAVAYSLVGLVAILANIPNADTARTNAITLSNLAVALTACVTVLSVAGLLVWGAITGVAALVTVATTLGLLVWALSAIDGVDTARENTLTLIMLLTALTNAIVILSAVGPDASIGIAAVNSLISVVTRLGALVTAVGWLSEHIDGLEGFIDGGLELLKKLASGLGEMISNFGEGLTSGLPGIGDNLSQFADKVGGFVTLLNDVDGDTVTNATNLIDAIKELVLSDLISKFTPGSLSSLGDDLSKFAANAGEFTSTIGAIKPEVATGMESFCNALHTLTETVGDKAWVDFWAGGDAFGEFGTSISSFATGMKDASIALSKFTDDDVANITRGAKAGEALAKLNESIPSSGGKWQEWTGEKSLSDWGTQISAFADSLVAYSAKVSGKNIDTEAITASATAAKAIADVNTSIPSFDGVLQDISGSKDIDDWGVKIVAFAGSLAAYSEAISGATFDPTKISESAKAAAALAEVANAIPESDGWFQKFAGEKNMASFGSGLVSFAGGITAYVEAAAGIDQTAVDKITFSGKAVDELAKVAEKVPESGGVGDWLGGTTDLSAFGTGLSKLADGVTTYVQHANALPDDADTIISDSGAAIDALATVVKELPDVEDNGKSLALKTAMGHLRGVLDSISIISTTEYDFAGTETIKTEISKIVEMLNGIDAATFSNNATLINGAIAQITSIATSISGLSGYTYGGVDTLRAALDSLATANVDGVIAAFSGKAGAMTAAMNSLVSAMTSGLSDGAGGVSEAASGLVDSAIAPVNDAASDFKTAGSTLALKLIEGLKAGKTAAETNGEILASKAKSGARSGYDGMKSAGEYLGDGLAAGISAKVDEIAEAAAEAVRAAIRAAEAEGEVKSPSRVFMRIGGYLSEGMAIGIDNESRLVSMSATEMARSAIKATSSVISRISDAINSDIDAQPTIRPVLDLTDVRAGAGAISGMLESSPIGVMTNLNSISSMMGRRGQNGANEEVVSAINRLRRDIGNMPRESYQINGVTYDDGSNIKSFAEAVVHQAKLERRV